MLTGQAAFTDAAHESPGTRRHLTVADLPAPAPRRVGRQRPRRGPAPRQRLAAGAQGLQGRALRHGPRQAAPDPHRAQRRPLPRRKPDGQDQASFAASTPTASRSRPSVFAEGLDQPFGIAFYPLRRRIRSTSTSATPTQHRPLPLQERRPEGHRHRWRPVPTCPAAAACAAAATGPATSSSPRTAASCSSPSARTPTSTTPTPIPRSSTAPTCSSSPPKASS